MVFSYVKVLSTHFMFTVLKTYKRSMSSFLKDSKLQGKFLIAGNIIKKLVKTSQPKKFHF